MCFGLPVDMEVFVTDIIDVEKDVTYRRCTTMIWVEEGPDNLVPHRYIAWYIWFDGDLVRPLRGFDGPPGLNDEVAPTVATANP